VLIDDVISGAAPSGGDVAAARLGQERILVAALVDRGARELPIRADIIGKNIDLGEGRRVNVMLEESDGVDRITVTDWQSRRAV
jgi:pyrimidine operon attenuation protein/uracil phosphoribosyltransferase